MFSLHPHAVAVRSRTAPRDLLALVRPGQWPKSVLVVPLVLLHPAAWTWPRPAALAEAVVLFVLASSVVYIGNDLADARYDRGHPAKRHRPIASGRVPVGAAVALGAALLAALVVATAVTRPVLFAPLGAYIALNVAYSRRLKHVPVAEVFAVATGFALRVLAGYLATGVRPSGWLLLCVFLLCFLPVLGKRRRELDLPEPLRRPVLRGYPAAFLDQLLVLTAGLTVVPFLFFALERWGPRADLVLAAALPPVLFGLLRYLHVVLVQAGGADPARGLLRDRVLLGTGAVVVVALATAGLLSP
ncbi:UbiA prenyltransferase family protein [Amycolatopsis sp. CA-126428]|uniref:UbiA prenyltransferase family protein n=1 Tax=Amycolatopsis sp. CA-126428 TaxID=2073158 RepID=UPI000CD15528|nr:UbiA prenyltransferase family protein [Amycolatopsis sp. CA-126428]